MAKFLCYNCGLKLSKVEEVSITGKVLIIEDDPSISRYLSFIVEKEGLQVSAASNGLEGLRKISEEKPGLVVLDVMLPGLDGFEICQRLRDDAATAHLPIILISAKGQDADRDTASQVGANAFFTKPVDKAALLSKIKELIAPDPNASR
jgi:DNA-binding response OmpR family regulator